MFECPHGGIYSRIFDVFVFKMLQTCCLPGDTCLRGHIVGTGLTHLKCAQASRKREHIFLISVPAPARGKPWQEHY